ncbi:MAG: hypothetical protein GX363_05835 [Clostridiales bacterium]|nr:hypothetical protein [Clostridiales bacterium]
MSINKNKILAYIICLTLIFSSFSGFTYATDHTDPDTVTYSETTTPSAIETIPKDNTTEEETTSSSAISENDTIPETLEDSIPTEPNNTDPDIKNQSEAPKQTTDGAITTPGIITIGEIYETTDAEIVTLSEIPTTDDMTFYTDTEIFELDLKSDNDITLVEYAWYYEEQLYMAMVESNHKNHVITKIEIDNQEFLDENVRMKTAKNKSTQLEVIDPDGNKESFENSCKDDETRWVVFNLSNLVLNGTHNLTVKVVRGEGYNVSGEFDIKVQSTLKYDGNGATSGTMDSRVEFIGKKFTLDQNEFEKTGYRFIGWNTEPDGSGKSYEDESSFRMPNHDVTLYAQWEKVSCKLYTVTFVAGDNGSLEGETVFADILEGTSWSEAVKEPEAIANKGYKFSKWDPELPDAVTESATYTAIFVKDKSEWHTITFEAGENGSLEGKTIFRKILDGTQWSEAVTVPNPKAKKGYMFVGWSPELPSEDAEITEDASYTAIFEKASKGHTVTFKAGKNGWLEGKTEFKNIKHGTSWDEAINVPTPKAKKGYMFDYWKPSFPDKVKKDGIYTAIFVKCHTIKFEAGKNGWLEGETVFRNIRHQTPWNDAVKVPSPKANKGYVFVGWSPVLPSEDDKVIKDTTYKAIFEKEKYTIKFEAAENGSLEGKTKFTDILYGTYWSCAIKDAPTPVPDPGYKFAGWEPGLPSEYSKVKTSATYTAKFVKDERMWHTVTFVAGNNGSLEGETVFTDILDGSVWSEVITVPAIKAKSGYKFSRWDPALPDKESPITTSTTFTAIFSKVKRSSRSSSTTNIILNKEDHIAYIVGYPDDTVRPERYITREEVAAVFYRLLTESYRNSNKTTLNNFSDVDSTRWSAKHISTLAACEIIFGYADGTFRPSEYITRAELATIASKFDDLKPFTADNFSDIKGHWANYYINSACEKGWVNGYPDGTFRPDMPITRAEFMTLVNNVLDRRVSKENILDGCRQFKDLSEGAWYYEIVHEAVNSHYYTREESTASEVWTEIFHPELDL